jgi:hypothetical protein
MPVVLFIEYVRWHYTTAILDLAGIVLNFCWFFHTFFGVGRHLKTFFVPFQRLRERSTKPLDIEDIAASFVVTALMRVLGMSVRSVAILCGLVLQVLTFLFGGAMLLVWLTLPVLLFVFFVSGMVLLFYF